MLVVLFVVMVVAVVAAVMVIASLSLVILDVCAVVMKLPLVLADVAPLRRGGAGVSPFEVLAQFAAIVPDVGFFILYLSAIDVQPNGDERVASLNLEPRLNRNLTKNRIGDMNLEACRLDF